jgi:hypothetical protein
MKHLQYSLLAEGPSDRALLPILDWLICDISTDVVVEGTWADLRRLYVPAASLPDRIVQAVEYYPCDLLFVHRDADSFGMETRLNEIQQAIHLAGVQRDLPTVVSVVPVRMLETWLLIDEQAIRSAAGNPNGREPIQLPLIRELETVADPKPMLRDAIRASSGLNRRRLLSLRVDHFRVANQIADFRPLLQLRAVRRLKQELEAALMAMAL